MSTPLVVDGPRPAVAWVASLPGEWTTAGERLLLLALACDAFDATSAPTGDALAEWTGMERSTVYRMLGRLRVATDERPALVADGKRRRRRAVYRLCIEVARTSPLDATSRRDTTSGRNSGRTSPPNATPPYPSLRPEVGWASKDPPPDFAAQDPATELWAIATALRSRHKVSDLRNRARDDGLLNVLVDGVSLGVLLNERIAALDEGWDSMWPGPAPPTELDAPKG